MSRVNDGICDCCDGADETPGLCKDDCEILLAEERRLRKEFEAKYRVGSKIRQAKVEGFERLRTEKLQEAAQIQEEINAMESSLGQLNNSYSAALQEWIAKRLNTLEERYQSLASTEMKGLVESLSEQELVWWIVHACQISGEMIVDGQIDESKTCIPLRMAGLDSSIWWEPKTYESTIIDVGDAEKRLQLAELWDYNLNNPTQLAWHPTKLPKKEDKGRRRLQEEEDDYYYDEDFDEDYYDHYDDEPIDDYQDPDYEDRYERHRQNDRKTSNDDSEEASTNKREEILELIKSLPTATARVSFMEKSEQLLLKIEEITKEDDNDDIPETLEEVEKVDGDGQEEGAIEEQLKFDPMALPMVTNKIKLRQKAISRGFDYAVSAYVLLESLQNYQFASADHFQIQLKKLAWNILNHGDLSAVHTWQLYIASLKDLQAEMPSDNEQTCVAPWASPCPPSTVTRHLSGEEISLPPSPIFDAGAGYCNGLYSKSMEEACASETVIPTDLPDGYFGYHQISKRSSDDLIAKLFEGLQYLSHESPERAQVTGLKSQLSKLESDLIDQRTKKSSAESSVGGIDGVGMFGPEGELHSLKDECFSFEAAKYTYDLCLFKGAKQKEGSHGGVNLGEWKDAAIDEDTGNRLWNWTKGTKCWNGPQRSATAVVTCGPETRIISADEPETCRYVFEVESPVGCDIAFARLHQL